MGQCEVSAPLRREHRFGLPERARKIEEADSGFRYNRVEQAVASVRKSTAKVAAPELMKDVYRGNAYKGEVIIKSEPEKGAAWSHLHIS